MIIQFPNARLIINPKVKSASLTGNFILYATKDDGFGLTGSDTQHFVCTIVTSLLYRRIVREHIADRCRILGKQNEAGSTNMPSG